MYFIVSPTDEFQEIYFTYKFMMLDFINNKKRCFFTLARETSHFIHLIHLSHG